LASFENSKFWGEIKQILHKIKQNTVVKNTDISVLSVFFSGIGFRFFSNTATA
jgi:hypothetical protein